MHLKWASPGGASGQEPACQSRGLRRLGFHLWVGTAPWTTI